MEGHRNRVDTRVEALLRQVESIEDGLSSLQRRWKDTDDKVVGATRQLATLTGGGAGQESEPAGTEDAEGGKGGTGGMGGGVGGVGGGAVGGGAARGAEGGGVVRGDVGGALSLGSMANQLRALEGAHQRDSELWHALLRMLSKAVRHIGLLTGLADEELFPEALQRGQKQVEESIREGGDEAKDALRRWLRAIEALVRMPA